MISIIFCQAPAKLHTVLHCYEHEIKAGNDVTIAIPANQNLNKFVESLHLKARIVYYRLPARLYKFWINKKYIKGFIRDITQDKSTGVNIYFTDIFDGVFGTFVPHLLKYHPKQIQSIDDIAGGSTDIYERLRNGIGVIQRLKEKTLSVLYNCHYCCILCDGNWGFVIDDRKYLFEKIDYSDVTIIKRYQTKVEFNGQKSVILFTEPYRMKYCSEEEYNRINVEIIEAAHQAGFKVAVKGHPRLGCQKEAEKIADYVIPSYIPSEYISLKCFDLAVGFTSTSLRSAADEIPAFSVMDMCEVLDKSQFDWFKNYLLRNNKVRFAKSYTDIFNCNNISTL